MMWVYLLCVVAFSAAVEEFEFGNTLNPVDNVEISASAPEQLPNITLFNIEGSGILADDSITLEIQVPYRRPTNRTAVIWILDMDKYTSFLNPIDQHSVLRFNKSSNCSTMQADRAIDSLFSTEGPTARPAGEVDALAVRSTTFFEADYVNDGVSDGAYNINFKFNGSYGQMEQCSRIGDKKVWHRLTTNKGIEYSASLYANMIEVSANDKNFGKPSDYDYNFYTHTFQIRWRISRYVVVNSVISSIERVKASLAYTSVQPQIQNGQPTDRTQIFIGIKTTLKVASDQSLMLNYQQGTGIFVPTRGEQTEVVQGPSSDERDNGCSIRYDDDNQELRDCEQVWEFSFLVATRDDKPIVGSFFFELALYTCDDIADQDLICTQLKEGQSIEDITVNLKLEQVVQVTDEKENYIQLVVESISSPDGANFKYGDLTSRGIYHKEEVLIRVKPADHYQIIQDNGLHLVAFLVCIEEELDTATRDSLGCLDAPRQHRYIAHMDNDIDLQMNGRTFKRDDFEGGKQALNTNVWDRDLQNYDISFINLALSGKARVYRFTMLFTTAQNADEIDSHYEEEGSRGRRSVMLHDVNRRDVTEPQNTTEPEVPLNITSSDTTSSDTTSSDTTLTDSMVVGNGCPGQMIDGECDGSGYSSADSPGFSILLLAMLTALHF